MDADAPEHLPDDTRITHTETDERTCGRRWGASRILK